MNEPNLEAVAHSFVGAFFAMQRELPEIKKESVAEIPNQKPRKYADLKALVDAVMPLFAKYGFIWSCQPTVVDEKPMMRYELTHVSHTDEKPQQRVGLYPIYGDNKPQALGAAITYAMRNALRAVVVLTPEDEEDAEGPKPGGRVVSRKASAKVAEPVDPDQVPGTPLPGEPVDRMTADQQKPIFAMLRKLGVADKDRYDKVNPILTAAGFEEVTSFTQITIEGGRTIYRELKKELDMRSSGSGEPT